MYYNTPQNNPYIVRNLLQIQQMIQHFWLYQTATDSRGNAAFSGDEYDYEKNIIYLTERIHQIIDQVLEKPVCNFSDYGIDNYLLNYNPYKEDNNYESPYAIY